MPRRVLALLTLFLSPTFALAQLPPQKALESLVVAPDLQVELFAHEPDLINPTSIDVDHLGRVWVCEAVNYRRVMFNRPILRPEGDRIVILEDTKGAGKADKATVFYQGKDLIAPIGIAVAPIPSLALGAQSPERKRRDAVRVFVCQSPDILVFEDLDGDGKADGPPKKFLTGFKGFDHDHGVHGINIGPDGKLYFTVGDAGVDGLKSSDGKGRAWKSNTTDCRAGTVWRCDMDGKNLEMIAHNFRNNYECCVNSFGEMWLSDNDDDGNEQTRICYVMPGGNYGYNPRGKGESHWHEEQPGIVHKVLRTGFGSPTGICFYEGTLLPERFRGQLLHTDAGPRELRCFHIKPKGAGYEAEKEVLVTSKDSWFRLSDVCVAPDGSVFLADWYDPGVGGHGMGDWTRGRIYRVTPKGHKGYEVPKVTVDDMAGTLNALASPNLATRSMAMSRMRDLSATELNAWTKKIGMGSNEAPKELHANGALTARFLWQYMRFLQVNAPDKDTQEVAGFLLFLLLWSNDGITNPLWVRILADGGIFQYPDRYDMKLENRLARPQPGLAVAREWLIALRNLPAERMRSLFYRLAGYYEGNDHFYRAALNIACGTDPARRDAILADFDKHFPEWNDKVADLVWELCPKSVLPRLEKLLSDPQLTAAQKGRIVDILAVNDDPNAGKSLLALLRTEQPAEMKNRAVENLRLFLPGKWKGLVSSPELPGLIDSLLADSKTAQVGLQLVVAAQFTPAINRVEDLANAQNVEAIRALGQLPDPRAVAALTRIMWSVRRPKSEPPAPVGPAVEAANALGVHVSARPEAEGQAALTVLQNVVIMPNDPIELKQAALAALAGSRAGTDWLLKLKQDGKMPSALVADAGRLLRNSPFQGQRNKAMLLFPPPGKLDPTKLPSIATLAKAHGDAGRGKQIMAASLKGEAQCLKCHTVRGVGGQVGPDLSMIGVKASRENLIESILQPSKAIADQFLQYQVELKAGQQLLGLLIEQKPDAILLRDANGKDYILSRGDIESITKSAVSIMPADIVKALSEDELLDVVEYMLTLKTPSLTPDFWHIAGPFPNDPSDSGLDTVYEPEKKVDLSATYKASRERERPDVRWSKVTRNADGYVDLMAHYAPKSEQIMSYLYREVESQVDQQATIALGTDDGAKLWLNGELVYQTRAHDAATPEKAKVKVKLKKGANTLLLKIVNGSNPHGFYLTLLGQQEMKAGK